MGDFHARIGQKQQYQNICNCVELFTVDKENQNGTRSIDYCTMCSESPFLKFFDNISTILLDYINYILGNDR